MADLNELKKIIEALEGLNPVEIIKGIESAFHSLPTNRWDKVSVNGTQVGPVTNHALGLTLPQSAWASWAWTSSPNANHTLRIDASVGSQNIKVTIDGTVVDSNGRLQIVPIEQGIPGVDAKLKISVRVSCSVSGTHMTYRFDGTVWP